MAGGDDTQAPATWPALAEKFFRLADENRNEVERLRAEVLALTHEAHRLEIRALEAEGQKKALRIKLEHTEAVAWRFYVRLDYLRENPNDAPGNGARRADLLARMLFSGKGEAQAFKEIAAGEEVSEDAVRKSVRRWMKVVETLDRRASMLSDMQSLPLPDGTLLRTARAVAKMEKKAKKNKKNAKRDVRTSRS